MPEDEDINLESLSEEQLLVGMGDLFLTMLGNNRVAVAVMSEEGAVTFLNPLLVQHIPAERLAESLLSSWSDDEVEKLLEHIYE